MTPAACADLRRTIEDDGFEVLFDQPALGGLSLTTMIYDRCHTFVDPMEYGLLITHLWHDPPIRPPRGEQLRLFDV